MAVQGLLLALQALSYPLDGEPRTGIQRLLVFEPGLQGAPVPLPAGALLKLEDIRLHLLERGSQQDPYAAGKDPLLQQALESIFNNRDPSYTVVVIDYTDPDALAWAGVREDKLQNPGSVGKVLTMIGLFHALAGVWPDPQDRLRVLRETQVKAGEWVGVGHHRVPRYNRETGVTTHAVPVPQDVFKLSEWLDHAVSASANGAGTVVWREAMLIRHFGERYPVSWEESEAWFASTPKTELSAIALALITEPLTAAGIDHGALRQGSLWTGPAKNRVPGTSSYASPRELAKLMLRMEQGRLVDAFSSLEMKRYLYFTRRRYRYTYAPELNPSAVYFKSGSLYKCQQEEGFACGKYMGNVRNYMNSVVIVESPAGDPASQKRYLVTLMSNVLRVNSAWDHSRIGAAIHEAVLTRKPVTVREAGSEADIRSSGTSQ